MRCIIYMSYESNLVSIDTHTTCHPRCTKVYCFFFFKSTCVLHTHRCIDIYMRSFMSTNIWKNVYMLYMYVFSF